MKLIGIREAYRSWANVLAEAQGQPVCVTNHGRPIAVILGVDGRDVREVLKTWDPEFSGTAANGSRSKSSDGRRRRRTAKG